MKVCPAFSPAGDYAKVAVRAPGGYPGGRFNVSQLPDQFSVAYTKTCRSFVLYWPTICEHLLVRAVSPINVTGHFSIRYITADGSKYFERKVHYGRYITSVVSTIKFWPKQCVMYTVYLYTFS